MTSYEPPAVSLGAAAAAPEPASGEPCGAQPPGRSTRRRSSCRLLLRAETCDAKSSLPCSSLPFVWRPACGLHEPCREGRGSVAGRRQGAGFLRGRRSRPGKHHRPAAVRRTSLNGMILALLGMPAASLKVVIRTYSLMRNVPSRLRKVGWLRYSRNRSKSWEGIGMRTDKEGRTFVFHGSLLGVGALLGVLWVTIKFSGIDWATQSATHALLFNEAFAVALAACGISWCVALAVRKPKAEGRAGLPLAACCAGTALVLLGSFVMGWYFLGADVPLVAIVLAGACFGMGMLMLGFGWLAAYAAFEPATALVHAGLSFVLAGVALCVRHAGFRRRVGRRGARPCRGGGLRPAAGSKGGSGTACRDGRRRRRAVHVEAAGRPGVRDAVVAAGRRHDRQLHPGSCMGPGGFADQRDRRLVGPLAQRGRRTGSGRRGDLHHPGRKQRGEGPADASAGGLSHSHGHPAVVSGGGPCRRGSSRRAGACSPGVFRLGHAVPLVGRGHSGARAAAASLARACGLRGRPCACLSGRAAAHPGGRDGWPRSVPGHAHGLSGAVLHLAGAERPDREAWPRDGRAASRSAASANGATSCRRRTAFRRARRRCSTTWGAATTTAT